MNTMRILLILLVSNLPTTAMALTLSQSPLFIASTEPRVMLLMSRDHELSKKAYTDYTDLNNDGLLDTTYSDNVTYYGYFDANKCYTYSTANSRFEPAGAAVGQASPLNHQCTAQWSGNFMNWATMTRLDVVRKVLYGGFRSTDSSGTAMGTTVLERAFLPIDVHAFGKVYAPAAGATDVVKYTPYSQAAVTLCNVTDMGAGVQAGSINTVNGTATSPAPLIKVASGSWPMWAMAEIQQCQWKEDFAVETSPTRPTKATLRLTGTSDLIARVAVCAPGMLEDKCKSYYTRDATPVQTVKPTGLLQQYGDVDVERRTRFGLMTGSYKNNTSGGVLRKNIKLLTNNANISLLSTSVCGAHTDDEIDVCTGQFINQTINTGIINAINRIHIAGYKTAATGAVTSTNVCAGGYNNSAPYACDSASLLSGTNGTCVDWGNPLSEMYHEALRYFAGKTSATAAYAVDDGAATAVISNLGQATWNSSSDPLPSTEWCALSNIIVLSTGLSSLDNASITTDITGLNPATLTNAVGVAEGVNGTAPFLIGYKGSASSTASLDYLCTSKILPDLSSASGICPEVPHMRGGYQIAGLASSSRSLDLRSSYATNRANRWTGINSDWVARQPLGTYAVGLAENLPSFDVTVSSGTVSLVPSCRSGGSTTCSMTDLRVESYSSTAASFLVSWEDGSAGSDYDMDTIARIQYCVGSSCSPTVSSNQIKVTVSAVQSATGSNPMELGYTVSGSTSDGTIFPIKLPSTASCDPTSTTGGDANFFSLLTTPFSSRPATGATDYTHWPTCPDGVTRLPNGIVTATGCPSGSNCGCPKVITYTQSSTPAAGLLKNPLWYAAKYGATATTWDLKNNITGVSTPDGEPDNFFDVRNPASLYASLAAVFDKASQPDASAASVATNSTNLQINGRIFQGKFSSADWSGQLLSFKINSSGVLSTTAEWDAGAIINSQSLSNTRVILTKGATDGVVFDYANLTGPTTTAGTQMNFLDKNALNVTDGCGVERVAYLRGDAGHEGTSGSFSCVSPSTSTISKFRPRNTSKLGDIVSSNPWYVGVPAAGYSDVTHPGYSSFLTSKLNRTPMVYVGSNDGMLHGFDASLTINTANPAGIPTSTSGTELLAYIPTAVFQNLSKLTDQSYKVNHLYFVDSSPMTADADLGTSTTHDWRTVLVGALGAGGKGYYALDISDPATFSQSTSPTNAPANTLLWEFDEADMGYVYNLPPESSATKQAKQIVKMANGKWAAILGNGYNSVAGKAVLYIVFINDGVDGTWAVGDTVKITADVPAGLDNGLSTPIPVDTNNDGYADTVYAGDIKGNLWKFLVGPNSSDATVTTTTSTWKLAFLTTANAGCPSTTVSCTPLFKPTDSGGLAQPIVSPPEIGAHPLGGQLVFFGTGKYIEASDNTNTSVQTFYGIWDKQDGSTTVGTRAVDLLQQTLSTTACASPAVAGVACTLTTAAGGFRIPTTNAITWRTTSPFCAANGTGTCPLPVTPTHMGWYIDLPSSKERVTGMPQLINKVVFFNTIIPSTAVCDAGGTGWLMSLDYLTGGLTGHQVFDTTGNGIIDSSDTKVAGFQVGAALGGTTLIQNQIASSNVGVGVSALTNSNLVSNLINFGTSPFSRLSWRELVQ